MKKSAGRLISNRKKEHLELCAAENVNSLTSTGLESLSLPHKALPEIDYADIDLATSFLGQKLKSPFLISSMSGGTKESEKLNELLLNFAVDRGIAMGVGSMRILLEKKDTSFKKLKAIAHKGVLYANIGAVQLNYGVKNSDIQFLIDCIGAKALILHLNPLQEAIQTEGNRNFKGLAKKIEALSNELQVPLIIKETGCGIDLGTARLALEIGASAIDVAGLGGTHWGYIEGLRDPKQRSLSLIFRNWGLSTLDSLKQLRASLPKDFPLIASGGILNGLDAAKGLYLGASLVGIAKPFLVAAKKGEKGLHQYLDSLETELKTALFCTGSLNPRDLKQTKT